MSIEDRVTDVVAPLAEAAGVELVDVLHTGGVLRVTVDREGGVDLDVIRRLTKDVSRALDDADPIGGSYTLEVSSPGLERALRRPDHFRRAVGESVSIKTRPGVDGDRRVAGTLTAADDDGVEVLLDDGSTRRVAHDEIQKARTTFEWPPPGKGAKSAPGGGRGGKNGSHADRKART